MAGVESVSAAASPSVVTPGARPNRSLPSLVVATVLVAALLFLVGAGPWGRTLPAAADQVSVLRARAQQLAELMTREQLQVAGYQQQFDAASARVAANRAEIQRVQSQLVDDHRRVVRGHQRVVHEALAAFVSADPSSPGSATQLFAADQTANLARAEYQQLIVGNVQTTLAELRVAQHALRAHRAMLVSLQDRAQQAADQAASLLAQSQQVQAALSSQEGQVTSQLASVITQVQTARATAAVRAATQGSLGRSAGTQVASTASPVPAAPGHATSDPPLNAFLQCVVLHESGGNYAAVSPGGQYMGAFQFSQSTWNMAAQLAGLPGLVGVPPNTATKADQDTLAVALYALDGSRPWYDPCRP